MDINSSPATGRVLIAAPTAYSLGGVATWLDYLVPDLVRRGWWVRVLLASGRWHDAPAYLREHPGLPAVLLENPTGSREGRIRAFLRRIRDANPDLLVVVNLPDAYEAVTRLEVRHRKLRVVCALHGIEPEYFEDLREFRREIDAVVSTNRLGCRLAEILSGFPSQATHHAPCGVEVSELALPWAESRPLEILFAGRLEERQKRLSDLAKIAARLAEGGQRFRLSIAGDGPDAGTLRDVTAGLVRNGLVRFLGRVPHQRLRREILAEHDLLLVTSSWETGPLVIWEAMARGLAVVSSRYVGSGLEGALVDGNNCRLFEIGDIDGAVRCVTDLATPSARSALARGGRRLVASRYSRQASVDAWESALRSVMASEGVGKGRPSRRSMPASGRLDRLLGARLAETARVLIGRRFEHSGPGGEWPHSYGERPKLEDFYARARAIDRGER